MTMRGPIKVLLFALMFGQLLFGTEDALAAPPSASVAAWSTSDLESFVDGAVAQQFRQYHLAGAVVTVVKDGQVAFSKGYGYADLASKTPMDPATTGLRVGSVGKLVTWTAVMQLVAEGRLDLDADVNRYLTAFKIPATRSAPITMRHLMTHSAGLDDSARGFLFRLSPDDFQSLEQTLIDHMPPRIREPGVVASYSNYGTALAGYIVQKVSGTPFDKYVERQVFAPLQMNRSTFAEPLTPSLSASLAKGYYFSGGRLVEAPFEYIHNMAPAGALTTTGSDMARFMMAHIDSGSVGGAALPSAGAIGLMHRRAFAQDPRVPGMALGFYEWWTSGRRLLTHKGRTTFFSTQVALLPEERLGVFVSFNSAEGSPAAEALIALVIDRYFAMPKTARSQPGSPVPVAGAYRTSWHSERTFEKLFVMGGDVIVDQAPDGSVILKDARGVQRFERHEPDYYLAPGSDEPLLVKSMPDGRSWLFRGTPVVGLYRLAWYETSRFHQVLLAVCFLSLVIAAPLTWRLWRKGVANGRPARLAIITMLASSLVVVAFAVGLGLVLGGPGGALVTYDIPPALLIILWLPPIALALLLVSLVTSAVSCRRLLMKPAYVVLAASLAACIWSANYWNLLGPRLG